MKASAERIYCTSLENFYSDCKGNENELFMVVHHVNCFASALFLSSESVERRYSLFPEGDENSFTDLVVGNALGIVLGLTKSGSIFTMDWLNRKLEKTQSTVEALPLHQSVINILDLGLFGTCSPICFARHSFENQPTDCSVAPGKLWREFGALAMKRYFVVGCSNGHVILLKLTRGRIQESSIDKDLKGLPNRLTSASSSSGGHSGSSSPRTPNDSLVSSSKADSRRSLSPMNTSRKRSSYGGARRRSREFRIDVSDFPEPSSRRQRGWFNERKPSEETAVDSLIYEFHRENLVFKVLPQRFSVVRICELPIDAGAGGFLLETESSELFYWHRAADISSISRERDSMSGRNRSTDTRAERDRFMSNRSGSGSAVGNNERVDVGVEGMAREDGAGEEVEDIWRDALSDEEAESPADSSRGSKTRVIGSWRSDGVTPCERLAVDEERDPDDWTEKKCSYGEVVYLQSTSWSNGCPSMSSGVALTRHWYSFLKSHSMAVGSSADAADDHAVALVGVLRRPMGILECYEIPSPDTAAMKRNDSEILEYASVRPRLSLEVEAMLSNRGKVADLLLLPVVEDESGSPLHLMAIALELPLADSHCNHDAPTAVEDNVWTDSMASHTNVIVLFDMAKTLVRQVFRCNSGEKLTDRMALLPSTASTLEPSILVTTNLGVVVIACKASSHRKSPTEEHFLSKKREIVTVPQAGEGGTVDALMVSQLRCAIQELWKPGSSQGSNKHGLEPLDKLLAAIPSTLVTRSIFRELLIHGLVDRAICLLRQHSTVYEFLCAWNEVSASGEGILLSPLNEEMCFQLVELYLPPEENLFFDSTHRQRWMDMQSSLLQLLTSIMSTKGQLMCILSSRGPLQKALLPRLYALLPKLTQDEIQFAIATFIAIIIRSEIGPRGASSPASLSQRKSGIPKLALPLTAQKASSRPESDAKASEPLQTRRLQYYSSAYDPCFKMRDKADDSSKYCKESEIEEDRDTKILLALSLRLLVRVMKFTSWEKESHCSDSKQWSSLLELVSEKESELSKDWSAKEIKGFVDGLVQIICSRAFAKCSEPSTSWMDCLALLVDYSERSDDCWLALNWCNQLLRAVGEPPVVPAMLSLALLNCSRDASRPEKNLQDHLTVIDTMTNALTQLRLESSASAEKMRSLETQMEALSGALGKIILSSDKQGIGQEFIDAMAARILASDKNEILTLGLRSLLVGLKRDELISSGSSLRLNSDEYSQILELKWSGKLLLLLHKVTHAAEFDTV